MSPFFCLQDSSPRCPLRHLVRLGVEKVRITLVLNLLFSRAESVDLTKTAKEKVSLTHLCTLIDRPAVLGNGVLLLTILCSTIPSTFFSSFVVRNISNQ